MTVLIMTSWKGKLKARTYNEVSGLIGADEESGWMSVHLVLESGRSAISCLSAQSIPELGCMEDRFFKLLYFSVFKQEKDWYLIGFKQLFDILKDMGIYTGETTANFAQRLLSKSQLCITKKHG